MCAQQTLVVDPEDVVADLEGQEREGSDLEGEEVEVAAEEREERRDDAFHCFTGHGESVFCVAWNSTDALNVASGGQDDTAFLWKTCSPDDPSGELPCQKLEGHTDSVISVAFSHDGKLLATAGMDGLVKVWSKEGVLTQTLEGPTDAISWMCWHPKGKVILAGSHDFSAWMWNAEAGTCMQVLSGHGGAVACGRFTQDGRSAVTAGDDQDPSLKVWNPRNAECVTSISGYGFHEAGINCLDLTPDGSLSLTGSADCTARLCNLTTGQPTATLEEHQGSVESVCFTNGVLPLLLTASLDGSALVWDRTSLTRRQRYEHQDGVACMEPLDSTPLFATGCMGGVVRMWDTRLPTVVRELHGHKEAIQCLAVHPAQQMIMTGSDDGSVRIYDLRV